MFLGEASEVSDQLIGSCEAINIDDLCHQSGCGGRANSGNGGDLPASGRRNLGESGFQQSFQLTFGLQAEFQLLDVMTNQLGGDFSAEACDTASSRLLQTLCQFGLYMRNPLQ
jgi:hypothetical protein